MLIDDRGGSQQDATEMLTVTQINSDAKISSRYYET